MQPLCSAAARIAASQYASDSERIARETKQIQKETEQIKKETDQIRSETEQLKLKNARLKPLNANGRALLNSIDRLCLAGDSSSAPTPRNRERWRLFLERMAQRLEPQSGG